MSEGDRPAETTSRVIPLHGASRFRRLPPLGSAADVARRLAALEQQVEEALGADRLGRATPFIEAAVEELLATLVAARTWLADQSVGVSPSVLGDLSLAVLARWWWRIDVVGRERIPAGAALLVANRGSALLPYEALMGAVALTGSDRGRVVQPFVDEWLVDLPLLGAALRGLGAEPARAARLRRVLERGDAALVFPEGRDAVARPYAEAYRIGRLARTGLLRVAIETGAPIVPVAVIGVDEVHPVLARIPLAGLAGLLGVPALPLPASVVPLPTKWRIFVGEPFDVRARHGADDARDPAALRALATRVRERLQALVSDGLRRRRSIFF